MNGWSSMGGDGWGDAPAWVYEITWEWEPQPGQRYPGDPGRRKAVHTPVYEASSGNDGRPSAPDPRPGQLPTRYGSSPGRRDEAQPYESRPPQGRDYPPPARSGQAPPQQQGRPSAAPRREEPLWNRPASALPEQRSDDHRPRNPSDQRRGSAPVYGRQSDQRPQEQSQSTSGGSYRDAVQYRETQTHDSAARPPQFRSGAQMPATPGNPQSVPVNPSRPPSVPVNPGNPQSANPGRPSPYPPAGRPVSPPSGRATPHGTSEGLSAPERPVSPASSGVYGAARPPAAGPYYGRRQAADDQRDDRRQRDGQPADEPRPVSPATGVYGSARPAPGDAFPSRPGTRPTPGRSDGRDNPPFDLRPTPQERGTPTESRPAPQPTRVTPARPTPPYPTMPDQPSPMRPVSSPAAPPTAHPTTDAVHHDPAAARQTSPAPAQPGAAHPADESQAVRSGSVWDGSPVPEEPTAQDPHPVSAMPAPEPPSSAAGNEEPHGLGWLLSQSGLGAVTPLPSPSPQSIAETPAAQAVVTEPILEPAPTSAPPAVSDPVVSEPTAWPAAETSPAEQTADQSTVAEAPAQELFDETRPVSGVPEKQDWFVPSGALPIIVPNRAETSAPDLDGPTGHGDGPFDHAPMIADEPAAAQAQPPHYADLPYADYDEPIAIQSIIAQPAAAPPRWTRPDASQPYPPELDFTHPVSAQPIPVPPVSAQPVSAQPISAQPISAQPISAQPISAQPVPAQPFATEPPTARPVSPASAPAWSNESGFDEPVSAVPSHDVPTVGRPVPEAPADGPGHVDTSHWSDHHKHRTRSSGETEVKAHTDEEPVEAELIGFAAPVDVQATEPVATLDDDIVDAELVDDAPYDTAAAALEAPTAPPALAAEPFAPTHAHIAEPAWPADSHAAAEERDPAKDLAEDLRQFAAEPDEDVAAEPIEPAVALQHEDTAGEPLPDADALPGEDAAQPIDAEQPIEAAQPIDAAQPIEDTAPAPAEEAVVGEQSEVEPVATSSETEEPPDTEASEAAGDEPHAAEAAIAGPETTEVEEADPVEPVNAVADETTVLEGATEPAQNDPITAEAATEPEEADAESAVEDDGAEPRAAESPAYAQKAETNDAPRPTGPAEPIRQRREQQADPRNRRTDPEQILAAYPVSYDPRTLREQIEDDEPMWVVIDRLTDKLEYAERDTDRARLLSLRAVASRLLGDLDPALEDARAAVEHATTAGDLVRKATVQARLGHVLQWRGEYAEADRTFTEANSAELPARLRAEIHELAGRSAFEQGRYLEAVNHLESALDQRKGADPDLVERIELALDTITGRTTEGWGPYPRTRAEILGRSEPERPLRDETSGLFGYPGMLSPRFAQAQPYAEGVAWVRRPEAPAWELIDESGTVLIDASSGYRAAGRFSEGLAWVSRDGAGGWHAVDKQNRVIVPGGFEDARPFHNGLALVRRGGWGVVDQHSRIVVQPHYQAFATMLASGEPVDGFTEEGLAVVDAGEVYGVVDRTGQLIVQPAHAALLIHPTAFLVADRYGLWGALDRKGEPLVELKYRDRAGVLDEIDLLVTESRPVL